MTRPSFIDKLNFELLQKKYTNEQDFKKVIEKIKNNYPVQYAIGNVDFFNCYIEVDERVLIPRFETELLVQKICNLIKKYNIRGNVLDLCTGSGCIAIAIAKSYDFNVDALDISKDALDLALKNSNLNQVKINFIKDNVLEKKTYSKKYSIVVSNPPYVKLNEYVSSNTKYEPQNALYAGKDNLIFYKKIMTNIKNYLNEKSIIAFEIGAYDGEKLLKIANTIYPNANILLEKDYANYDRFLFIINE